ncbi:methionyl-tRNA formyltransferase [Campylobacter sp. FMV-PI01]|uniref:Methionyl-tRNA formyltransferase n=1 Tax=Campylobacter portucalensis TaxID=2608384 RepID=A0A6L5WHQ3_9BACT|nr:methionyl-tRNA formyltransferase [Campylobacter portucalensis]MSN96629.1 methionyl-tRNA formyltransferase [Campylobacter portucalensis]
MKIVFMGTPSYALQILQELILNDFEIVCVVTQEDKVVGRKQILTPPIVKEWILKSGKNIKIFQPKSLKEEWIKYEIENLKPDFIVVAAYGKILPKSILDIAPCINLHTSILPKYRGASPIQSAILDGLEISGVTAMKMDIGLDDGDILDIEYIDIKNLKSDEVFEKMSKVAANLTIKVLNNYKNIKPVKQNHALATSCKKIKKMDGIIKFSDCVDIVMRKFRAFYPWPGIFLENGTKLLDIKISSNLRNFELGRISNLKKDSFSIQFQDGEIEILKLQEIGKKPIFAKDFINGKRLKIDDKFCY